MTRYLLIFAGLFVLSPMANALVFYTDRSTFESDISVGQIVDFESPFSFSNTILTFGDATFISTDGSGIHRTDSGTFGGSSTRLAAQNSGGIAIELAAGHQALGLDVGELFPGVSTGTFTLYDAFGALLDTVVMEVGYFGGSPSFVGWTNTTDIGRLEFFVAGSNVFETIDNVTLGTVSRVPEPATMLLFGAGLLGLLGMARRKAV